MKKSNFEMLKEGARLIACATESGCRNLQITRNKIVIDAIKHDCSKNSRHKIDPKKDILVIKTSENLGNSKFCQYIDSYETIDMTGKDVKETNCYYYYINQFGHKIQAKKDKIIGFIN